ncbi:MAG: phospholipid/cholesterol/gamma-HCH transport system substrate-binding protein [Actinomycetota bacterium]|jgi:virulence factor Mce-like protein|nr:phospholipid/cholesterol/gamma-HCH transport system substrate-binding protein [Actinomycetota bacterium]
MNRIGRLRLLVPVVALSLAGATAGCGVFGGGGAQKHLTAHFARTVGLYKHSDVRVLGVRIGQVTSIKPEGRTVRVEMEYDAKYKLPVDAKAVVIAPSIVSDRYVQITPVWKGGEALPPVFDLTTDRTAVPVELDQIYSAIDQLNQDIGPNGANKNGALSDLLHVGAQNLKGNGEVLNSALEDLSQAVSTLSTSRSDLFASVDNLQDFTTTLANSDRTVRQFNTDLADVASQLSGERQDLATAIRELSVALGEVASFVRDNKTNLTANVKDLASVTSVLVKQKRALEEFLDNSATALSNLQLAYNPKSGTLDTRDNNSNQTTPQGLLCGLLTAAGQSCPAGLATAAAVTPTYGTDRTLGGILGGGR